ncbi:DsbA family protein [Nitrosomonas mobilis]|uniref:DsbA family protein n=1 Tax=Nitrosomonas mobilis TaxID=51642 RepID=UPI000B7CF122|nr:DsbA family protein [Nitrosomonas mobilis]
MCSWCYAFSRSWTALQLALPKNIEIIHVLGGLAPDTSEPMPPSMQKHIQQAWRQIEQTVPGVQFNWDFWSQNQPIRSTYPACRAILAARKQREEAMLPMLHAIQQAYYRRAQNPSLSSILEKCAGEIGLNTKIFSEELNSPETIQVLQREVQLARRLGAHSFPALRLLHNGSVSPVKVDYVNSQTMLNEINMIIRESSRKA